MALPTIELGKMDRFDYIPIALILRDTNPLHLDRVYAQERGLPDVVQQGPLSQAYLYRYFTTLLHDPWDLVTCALWQRNQRGATILKGEAKARIPSRG